MEHHQLLLKIEKAFPECDEEGCLKIYENVLRCVGNKRYVCSLKNIAETISQVFRNLGIII